MEFRKGMKDGERTYFETAGLIWRRLSADPFGRLSPVGLTIQHRKAWGTSSAAGTKTAYGDECRGFCPLGVDLTDATNRPSVRAAKKRGIEAERTLPRVRTRQRAEHSAGGHVMGAGT